MAVARTTEIVAGSPDGFKAAIKTGIARATKTLDNVTGAWIQDQEIVIDDDKIVEYSHITNMYWILLQLGLVPTWEELVEQAKSK